MSVPFPQHTPALFFKAVTCLLAVPDGARERKLSSDAVFPNSPKRAAPELLSLDIMRFEPQLLQFRMVVRRELVALENLIKLSEISPMKSDHSFRFEHTLVLVEMFASRQRPQKAPETFNVSTLLKDLADARHLLLRKAECWKHRHGLSRINVHFFYLFLFYRRQRQFFNRFEVKPLEAQF